MSAAEREAERRWPGIGRGAERAALDRAMRGGFEAGAEWQAERDAERIAELEAEVERLRVATDIVRSAAATSRVMGGAVQATAESLVRFAAMDSIDRAGRAEAKLAAVREYIVAVQNSPGLGQTGHHGRWLREALAVLDGGDET